MVWTDGRGEGCNPGLSAGGLSWIAPEQSPNPPIYNPLDAIENMEETLQETTPCNSRMYPPPLGSHDTKAGTSHAAFHFRTTYHQS